MICPRELALDLPVMVGDNLLARTGEVWRMLEASASGDLQTIRELTESCSGLAYAQFNYAPPIHFAVREGHVEVVRYLLGLGAYDPSYRVYPFGDSLETIAAERGFAEIGQLLIAYAADPSKQRYSGDNGEIFYERTKEALDLEAAVTQGEMPVVLKLLKTFPHLVHDHTLNWSEGIMAVPANRNNRQMVELLLEYGATVPLMLKWAPAYYFKHMDMAALLLTAGMSADTRSWQQVTVLHNMAQQGEISKAALLLDHGADINAIDEAYLSTPLAMAARWGRTEMVRLLLDNGAQKDLAGAPWALPLAWARSRGHSEIEMLLGS